MHPPRPRPRRPAERTLQPGACTPTAPHPNKNQVTNQPDGARLLLTLESKRTDSLTPAAERLKELLPEGALIGEQRDVTRLTLDSVKNP
jgi:hypothetical protein